MLRDRPERRGFRPRRGSDERFWSQVQRIAGCWLWTGTLLNSGYGQVMLRKRKVRAHRLAWELTFGPIPEGMVVCHACDNPACVNPHHLWLGTVQANVRDRDAKGRTRTGPQTQEWIARRTASRMLHIAQAAARRATDAP